MTNSSFFVIIVLEIIIIIKNILMKVRGLKVNYLIAPLGVLIVSLLGGYISGSAVDWYNLLKLPPLSPSGIFVSVVWNLVFILAAFSVLLFSNNPKADRKSSFFYIIMALFVLNGALNVLWVALFFYWHFTFWSFLCILALNLLNLILILMLWRGYKLSASLFIVYFLWLLFVTYLNYSIYLLN